MRVIKLILLGFVYISISLSCSKEHTNKPKEALNSSEYYQKLNISYGSDKNQKFDIYLPANRSSSTKTMILIHGGGWSAGDKTEMDGFKDILRQDLPNVAIVNINYRLANTKNSPYPMQLDDITTVINHLIEQKDYYVISDDFGFIGASAGAHLSLLWSYAFDSHNHIKMVCSIVGPTDLTDTFYVNNTDPNIKALIDLYGMGATTDFLKKVSPYYQVTASAPPTILFYGGNDPLVPTTQGTTMRDRLQQLGVTHEFTLYENAGHGWVGLEILDTWLKLKQFIQQHL